MNSSRTLSITTLLLVAAPGSAVSDEVTTLKEIMQGLRDDLVTISDGLLTDDYAKIRRGASGIANHPRIPPQQVQLVAAELGPEMAAFKQLDTLVHDLSLEVGAAAAVADREAAVSGYLRIVEGCLACHQSYKERVRAVLE